MRFRLTPLGKLFLIVALLLYLASLTSQSGLLLLLIGILMGCYLLNTAAACSVLKGLALQAPKSSLVAEGRKSPQAWQIRNHRDSPALFIEAATKEGPLFRLGTVPARTTAFAAPEQTYQRRGVYPHSEVRLASTYPFGLIAAVRSFNLAGEIAVHPAVFTSASPPAAGFDVMVGGKFHGIGRSPGGSHFAGIRPLQPGDPLRHVHWKSSAKGRGLMVKTYDEELSGRVAIITGGGPAGDGKALDDCYRAAGSLMFAALEAGHHVEWMDLTELEHRLFPPFTDGHNLLEALARVEGKPGCLDLDRLEQAIRRFSPRSAISFVLTEWNAAAAQVARELNGQRRKIAVYLPEGVPLPSGIDALYFRYQAGRIVPATLEDPERGVLLEPAGGPH